MAMLGKTGKLLQEYLYLLLMLQGFFKLLESIELFWSTCILAKFKASSAQESLLII